MWHSTADQRIRHIPWLRFASARPPPVKGPTRGVLPLPTVLAGTVRHTGGCLQPVLLRGRADYIDGGTGELLHRYTTVHEPGGVLPIDRDPPARGAQESVPRCRHRRRTHRQQPRRTGQAATSTGPRTRNRLDHSATPRIPDQCARLHDLRHLHATTLLLSGVPVYVVAARLGHADPAVTLRVYAHVIRSAEAAAADIFAQAIKAG